MRGWAGPLFVVLLAATAPLLLPRPWTEGGTAPDFAVLALVYVAYRGTPDRAALTGVAIGALAALWTAEPFTFRPCVLGAIGWGAGQAAGVLDRERALPRAAIAAAAVLVERLAGWAASAAAGRGGAPWEPADAARLAGAATVAAAVAALLVTPWFAVVRRTRLLAPLERSFRDV